MFCLLVIVYVALVPLIWRLGKIDRSTWRGIGGGRF
jgi:hypothetical protein